MKNKEELQKEIWFLKLGYFFLFLISIRHFYMGYGAYEMLVFLGIICISLVLRTMFERLNN